MNSEPITTGQERSVIEDMLDSNRRALIATAHGSQSQMSVAGSSHH